MADLEADREFPVTEDLIARAAAGNAQGLNGCIITNKELKEFLAELSDLVTFNVFLERTDQYDHVTIKGGVTFDPPKEK